MLNFSPINIYEALFVLVATAGGDILWALYIRRTNEGAALSAALFSSLIILIGALVITTYIQNSWYLVPTVLGGFAGTFLTVKIDGRKNKKADATDDRPSDK